MDLKHANSKAGWLCGENADSYFVSQYCGLIIIWMDSVRQQSIIYYNAVTLCTFMELDGYLISKKLSVSKWSWDATSPDGEKLLKHPRCKCKLYSTQLNQRWSYVDELLPSVFSTYDHTEGEASCCSVYLISLITQCSVRASERASGVSQ